MLIAPCYAQDRVATISEDEQLGFADSLVQEGEYYRAVTEYKRFLYFYPQSDKRDVAHFRIGTAFFAGEDYGEAVNAFHDFRQFYTESKYILGAHYLEGTSYWRLKRYDQAQTTFETIIDFFPGTEDAQHALKAMTAISLDKGDAKAGLKYLNNYMKQYGQNVEIARIEKAKNLISEYENAPRKSRALAATLSAIIPGTGYMYAGRYGDGWTAFATNALFIYGTVTAVQQENYTTAYIVGAFGLPFYIGNIYGSANAVKKWNLGVRKDLHDRIFITLGFDVE